MIQLNPVRLGREGHQGWLVYVDDQLIAVLEAMTEGGVCLAAGFDHPYICVGRAWYSLDVAREEFAQVELALLGVARLGAELVQIAEAEPDHQDLLAGGVSGDGFDHGEGLVFWGAMAEMLAGGIGPDTKVRVSRRSKS